MNTNEFTLKADGDVLIGNSHRNSIVIANFDVRDVLDQIENKDIASWKGNEILKEFTKNELINFIEYYYEE